MTVSNVSGNCVVLRLFLNLENPNESPVLSLQGTIMSLRLRVTSELNVWYSIMLFSALLQQAEPSVTKLQFTRLQFSSSLKTAALITKHIVLVLIFNIYYEIS